MILFFGTRLRRTELGTGAFHCPVCQVPRGYTHVEVRNWFHVFWLPIVPLGTPFETVRGTACGHEFDATVLQGNPLG